MHVIQWKFLDLDDAFFNRNWAGVFLGSLGRTRIGVGQVHRLCVVGPGCDCYCADRLALDVALLCKKNEKDGCRRGFRPWPLRCLSQILLEIEDGLL